MVGKESPAGLAENDQFRKVVADYGTKELCARLHIKPGRLEGRFEIHDGYTLGALKGGPGAYDANALPDTNGERPPREATQGDTYIAAMGRFLDLPPPVAKLVNDAVRKGGKAERVALKEEGFYVGYSIIIKQADGSKLKIDVTGAASRLADQNGMHSRDTDLINASKDHDAPPESGIFDGSYAASSRQAARYRARRKQRGY